MNGSASDSLTLLDLLNIQRTLQRRARARDGANHLAIGFGPKVVGGVSYPGLSVRYVVRKKKLKVAAQRRIPETESIRLRQTLGASYRSLQIPTDVVESPPVQAVGVGVNGVLQPNGQSTGPRCTTSLVIRWTTANPAPRWLTAESWDDPRWRWGVMTVAHGITKRRLSPVSQQGLPRDLNQRVTIERVLHCGQAPTTIWGRVVARGRLPGEPDCALLETGADRLWLSGMLPLPEAAALPETGEADVLRWVNTGGWGYVHSLHQIGQWELEMYFPERTIDSLGRLQQVLQVRQRGNLLGERPFAPGTSGAALVEAGIPIALQVAATRPDFATGFAQSLSVSLAWLRRVLGATSLGVVGVL